jgi:hypothetical protein
VRVSELLRVKSKILAREVDLICYAFVVKEEKAKQMTLDEKMLENLRHLQSLGALKGMMDKAQIE